MYVVYNIEIARCLAHAMSDADHSFLKSTTANKQDILCWLESV